ncbi:Hypothetical_protein [Hexamita inflata]|uniref:Hypothetical_protein n=1 Tax=Hexamita inflata TaxID=28002 RepID=A0ABP1HKT0_9EUKA
MYGVYIYIYQIIFVWDNNTLNTLLSNSLISYSTIIQISNQIVIQILFFNSQFITPIQQSYDFFELVFLNNRLQRLVPVYEVDRVLVSNHLENLEGDLVWLDAQDVYRHVSLLN